MAMRLTSGAFHDHERIPLRFTCDGSNASPPLTWSGAPPETRSFALVCVDPDAPSGNWYHWAIYDMPREMTHLSEDYPQGGRVPPQALNDFRENGYGGPCPPHRHGDHHYHFQLFALNVEHLPVPAKPRCRDVENMARALAVATTELVGVYSR